MRIPVNFESILVAPDFLETPYNMKDSEHSGKYGHVRMDTGSMSLFFIWVW